MMLFPRKYPFCEEGSPPGGLSPDIVADVPGIALPVKGDGFSTRGTVGAKAAAESMRETMRLMDLEREKRAV